MARPLPVLGLLLLIVLAGCLGGLGLGTSSQPTTTTTTTQTPTTESATPTTTTTPATQTTTTTSVARNTSVHLDPPDGGDRFTARVVKVLGPETLKVRRKGGETVVVELIGIETPQSAGNTDPAAFEGVPSS